MFATSAKSRLKTRPVARYPYNKDEWDGIVITYADTGEERESRECFVQGVRCWASQAHFGGVVIQPFDEPKSGVQQTVTDARNAYRERLIKLVRGES